MSNANSWNHRLMESARSFVGNVGESTREVVAEIGRVLSNPPIQEIRSVSQEVPFFPWQSQSTQTVNRFNTEARTLHNNWRLHQAHSFSILDRHFTEDPSQQIQEFIHWFTNYREQVEQPVPRPLPDRIKRTIKILDSSSLKDSSEVKQCPICLESLCDCLSEDCDTVSQLPCGHCFHTKCVDQWFLTSPECPVCRRDLRDTNISQESSISSSRNIEVRVRHRTGETQTYSVNPSDNVSSLANQMSGGIAHTVYLHLGKNVSLDQNFTDQDIQEGDLLVEWVKL